MRNWNLTDDSTRYDRLVAANSDADLVLSWSLWAGIAGVVGIFVILVFLSILRSRRARSNPFNMYLVYLMIPDMAFTIGCAVTCALNASQGHYWSERMCRAQSAYLVWGLTGNNWLNGTIAWQLHKMLRSSHRRLRYRPPTHGQVFQHAMLCYAWAAIVASWGVLPMAHFPHQTNALKGLACLPVEYSTTSTIFYFAVYVPAAFLIPMNYALYVLFDVLYHKLLPPRGKRRLISFYFFRVRLLRGWESMCSFSFGHVS